MSGEGPTDGISDRPGAAEKKTSSINVSKAKTKVCLILHYNDNESYLYVKSTEIYKFKAKDKISWYNFCLGSVPKDFTKDEQSDMVLCMIFLLAINQLKKETFLIFTSI